MGIVQLAESQGATHAKTTQPGSDGQDPPRVSADLDSGLNINYACRRVGIGITTYYHWKALRENPASHEQVRVSELEVEVDRLKLLAAELALDRRML